MFYSIIKDNVLKDVYFLFFISSPKDVCRERKGGRGRREETSMQERNIDQLPQYMHALTMDQTQNLGMFPNQESNWHKAEPTEPLWQGKGCLFINSVACLKAKVSKNF